MKKFNYNASGILSFTHQNKDYVINGIGPHNLPEDNLLVISLKAQKIITELAEPKEIKQVKKTNI